MRIVGAEENLKAMEELDIPKADKEKIYCLNAKKIFGV